MIDPFWDDCSKKKYETPVIEETEVMNDADVFKMAEALKDSLVEIVGSIQDLNRRVARIEEMLDLLGNIATKQKIEYERFLNQIHEELWREDEE